MGIAFCVDFCGKNDASRFSRKSEKNILETLGFRISNNPYGAHHQIKGPTASLFDKQIVFFGSPEKITNLQINKSPAYDADERSIRTFL